jgi:PKD repeat protein
MHNFFYRFLIVMTLLVFADRAGAQCNSGFVYSISCTTVNFTDSSTTNTPIVTHSWDFGDGTRSSQKNPVKTYSAARSYQVTLIITGRDSSQRVICVDSTIQTINLNGICCNSFFTEIKYGLSVEFQDKSNHQNKYTATWNYGDGQSGSSNLHVYKDTGAYTVCLSTYDSVGDCRDTFCKTIGVDGVVCDPSFFAKVDSTNKTISLYAQGSSHYTNTWLLGGGVTISGKDTLVHTFDSFGLFSITHRVFTTIDSVNYDCDSTIVVNIPRESKSCRSDWTYNKLGSVVKFSTLDSGGTQYKWRLGDGQEVYRRNHTYQYKLTNQNQAETFNVCLEVTDTTINCATITCKAITIFPDSCDLNATFTYSLDTVLAKAQFFPAQNDPRAEHGWLVLALNDTLRETSPQYTFYGPGNYSVYHWVILRDSQKNIVCADTFIGDVFIPKHPECFAQFKVAIDTNEKFKLYIVNQSVGANLNYHWDMGDGMEYRVANPSHRYQTFGKFWVVLTVERGNCTSSIGHFVGMDSSGKLLKQDGFDVQVIDRSVIGIPEVVESELRIFPNPSFDELYIEYDGFKNKDYTIILCDLKGQQFDVPILNMDDNRIKISLQNLTGGSYIIRVQTENGLISRRIIKI